MATPPLMDAASAHSLTDAAAPTPWAAIIPLIAILPAVICMVDIARHPRTRQYPPQVWLAICACGNVLGLVAYLRFGRADER